MYESGMLRLYERIFDLSQTELLEKKILNYRPHQTTFESEITALGGHCVSFNPACLTTSPVTLPYDDFFFDLALSVDYFFEKKNNKSIEARFFEMVELARVAKEVRIFPLGELQDGQISFLGPLLLRLQQEKLGAEVRSLKEAVDGQHAFLRIWALQCPLI